MELTLFLGYVSTFLGIIQNIPQIALTYKVKHTDELSLSTMLIRLIAVLLSSFYISGIIVQGGLNFAIPMIIGNVSSWITTLLLLYFKLYLFKDKDDMWNQMQEHIPYLQTIFAL